MTNDFIFVITSFNIKDNCISEWGKKIWFFKLEDAEKYLNDAGKKIREHYYHGDPFECRWNYAVIEKCYQGAGTLDEVISYWKAYMEDGHFGQCRKLDKTPEGLEESFGFTFG